MAAVLASGLLALVHLLAWLEGTQLTSLALVSVVLSAIYGGMGPALLAAAISAVGIDYFIVEPVGSIFQSWIGFLRVLTYGTIGVVVASIVASLRAAYRELHAQYRETDQAKRARENMLAIVSHDLRSPLSAVLLGIGYVKDAASQGTPIADLGGALDAVHRSADAITRLVDDLLDAAAIEAGRFSIAPKLQPVPPIVEEAVDAARLAADAKRIRIELSMDESPPSALVDRQRLTQVLANLIGNAVKFSPEGARVGVALHADPARVRIEVSDMGPGISQEELPQLFSRHWQAPKTAHLGTGLGLFIARSIVEAHGGSIEVDSAPGRGARFGVILPATADRRPPAAARPARPAYAPRRRDRR
jgi:signal transduction histidine kinase